MAKLKLKMANRKLQQRLKLTRILLRCQRLSLLKMARKLNLLSLKPLQNSMDGLLSLSEKPDSSFDRLLGL